MKKKGKKRKLNKTIEESIVARAWGNIRDLGGFSTLTEFAKSRKNAYDLKDLDKQLSKLKAFSMHRQVRRKYRRPAYIFHGPNQHYSADLIQMTQYRYHNSNYAWILLVIDSFSKVISCVPMKSKGAEETALAVKKALRELSRGGKRYPEYFFHDMGKELVNKRVKAVLSKHNIKQYYSKTNQKASIAERHIKTIKTYLFKYFSHNNTKRWVDVLPLLVNRLNNRIHTSHGMIPSKINDKNTDQAFSNMYGKLALTKIKPAKYSVGTLVRISSGRILFRKAYEAGFSSQVFRIKSIKPTIPVPSFVLETLEGQVVPTSFTAEELSEYIP